MSATCLSFFRHMPIPLHIFIQAVHVRTQCMHVGTFSLTRQPAQSILPTGGLSQVLSNLCSCVLALPALFSFLLAVCPYYWCQQDDIMFPVGQQASQPALAVCLLRDCRKSLRNIHSMHLGKPISYFSLNQRGLESHPNPSFSVCLSAAALFSFMCTLSPSSSHFLCHLLAISLSFQRVFFISLRLIQSLQCYACSPATIFALPSPMINHNKREILQWKPGSERDIHPVLAGKDGRDYKYYIYLAVNIFIRG